MQIKFVCPYWGWRGDSAVEFISQVVSAGYHGIEIDIPEEKKFETELLSEIAKLKSDPGSFIFVAQQWLPPAAESFEDYKKRFIEKLNRLISFRPGFINSHTGKDFFSFDQNCELIETAMNISSKSGILILHETHRGRFSFHLPQTLIYLKKFPDLQLVADFSHWCTVSESLLEDQEEALKLVIPHCAHIHARIGHEHSPQVNDFRAPEWKNHVEKFFGWWQIILDHHKAKKQFTISPEFGPVSYMPTEPFTQKPLSNQWEENIAMMQLVKSRMKEFVT